MDALDFARYVGALFFTLALLGLFLAALRRFGPTLGLERLGRAGGGARRMQVVETLMLDPRRRLMIVRADDREHLVLLGASGETVLDSRAPDDDGDGEGDAAL